VAADLDATAGRLAPWESIDRQRLFLSLPGLVLGQPGQHVNRRRQGRAAAAAPLAVASCRGARACFALARDALAVLSTCLQL